MINGWMAATLAISGVLLSFNRPQSSLADSVALYAAGSHNDALRAVSAGQLTVAALIDGVEDWEKRGDRSSRRAMLGVAFALELVWARTRTGDNARQTDYDRWKDRQPDPSRVQLSSFESQGLVSSWAARKLSLLKEQGESLPTRALWLAVLGIAEDGHAWRTLDKDILPMAGATLGDDPRLRLARVLATNGITVGPLRTSTFPTRRADVLRDERLKASAAKPLAAAISALDSLSADATLKGEASVRMGYLELRRRQMEAALQRFAEARSSTEDVFLLSVADYLAGWVNEQQGNPDVAIDNYRRARQHAPTARNLSILLAALLFTRNARDEAYAILHEALEAGTADDAALDPLVQLERGDGRFVPVWLADVRRGS